MKSCREELVEFWGESGERVIQECEKVAPFDGDFKSFLDHCVACGGNWGGMLLSGVKELFPTVWEAIPENMGENSWVCICDVIVLLGVRV